nr:hypothetical protein [Catenuloplanes niger]
MADLRVLYVLDLPGEAVSLVANLPQTCSDLVLRPVRVAHEIEEPVFLSVQFVSPGLDACLKLCFRAAGVTDHLIELFSDPPPQVGGQCDRRVVVPDRVLDAGDRQVREVADVALPAPAEVVEVVRAGVALAPHDHEPALAAMTPDGALEVMVVRPLPDTARAPRFEHLLHPLERLGIDQRFVAPAVLLPSVGDIAEVVAVAEQVADRVDRDGCAGGVAAGRLRPEARVGQGVDERVESVGAGRVQLERHPDQRAALGVDRDRPDLAALERLTDVEVADRRPTDRATFDDLLAHLVRDVRAGRPGLVLVDRVEDGGDQVTDRRVLGVVHDRDQNGPGGTEIPLGDRGVDAVPVQPGSGVDDHVVDAGLSFESRHHLAEDRASVGRGGGSAGLHELLDDLCAKLGGAALDGSPLCRERDALGVVVGVDLAGRRDPQVGESSLARRPVVMAARHGLFPSSVVLPVSVLPGALLGDEDERPDQQFFVDGLRPSDAAGDDVSRTGRHRRAVPFSRFVGASLRRPCVRPSGCPSAR